MNKSERSEYLKKYALERGADLFGIADMKGFELWTLELGDGTLHGLDYGISLAVRISNRIIEDLVDHPTRLYFYHYRQVNYFLDRIAVDLTSLIQGMGGEALPIPASQVIDFEGQRGHLSHKRVAFRAGLGWRGRNNLLVTPGFGAMIRLVTILTDLEVECDSPLEVDCGDCRECLDVCPADAIKEDLNEFDRDVCYQCLDSFRKKYQIGHHICGLCIKSCSGKKGSASE